MLVSFSYDFTFFALADIDGTSAQNPETTACDATSSKIVKTHHNISYGFGKSKQKQYYQEKYDKGEWNYYAQLNVLIASYANFHDEVLSVLISCNLKRCQLPRRKHNQIV